MNNDPTPETKEIREVELIFEDEVPTAERGTYAGNPFTTRSPSDADSTMPHFPQSPHPRFERAERPDNREGNTAAFSAYTRDDNIPFITAALPQGRISTKSYALLLIAAAVLALFSANISGHFAIPGVTTLLATSAGPMSSVATIVLGLFSPVGAVLMVFAAWNVLSRRGYRHSGFALFIAMWTAWIISAAFSSFAFGTVPVLILGLAFCSAAILTASTLAKKHLCLRAAKKIWGFGALFFAAIGTLLIAAGYATLLAVSLSGIVGAVGALLGIRAWNRWWVPMIDTQEQFRRIIRRVFRARTA